MKLLKMEEKTQVVALYARVSGDKQAQEGTIDSQIAELREYAHQHRLAIQPDLIFIDNGVSGATLIRPALEKLRDRAFAGDIDQILILSPDRLARKYAHQLLLVEEFQKLGVSILFVNRILSDSPEDQLLFQIQGVISEFEREKILERSRRGKLHKAKQGRVSVMSSAPYGYVYIRMKEHEDARWEIHPEESKTVRKIFKWYTKNGVSVQKIAKQLDSEHILTRQRGGGWRSSVVYQILNNPAYTGNAAYRKTQSVPRARNRGVANRAPYPKVVNSSRKNRPQTEWIRIHVPPIIDSVTYKNAQKQLQFNKKFASRNNRKYNYLASGLLRCKECGYAMFARGGARRPNLRYYQCIGSKRQFHHMHRLCASSYVRVDIVDDLLWDQTRQLLQNPQWVLKEYSERIHKNQKTQEELQSLILQKKKELRQKETEKDRLLDLYQSGSLEKKELEERIQFIRTKIKVIEQEITYLEQEGSKRLDQLRMIEKLENFTSRLDNNLFNLEFEKKREIVKQLVHEVVVDRKNNQLNIHHVIPINKPGAQLYPDSRFSQI
jgi:site-specific DNA recombinase